MFALFVASGLRISELHQLNRNSIQVKRVARQNSSMIFGIGEVMGKGRKQRTFLVEKTTCKALGELLRERGADGIEALFVSSRGGRLSVRAIRERFHYWCRRLDLPLLRVHQLRHTFATRMANAGMPSLVLRDLMGHNSFNTTLGYFRTDEKNIAQQYFAAMESLSRSG
jgi:integrase/recombinase XerC